MPEMVHPIAAVSFAHDDPVDKLLDQVASRLTQRGFRLEGFLQRETPGKDGCCPTMVLDSIATGSTKTISQQLGKLSRGCRLDPQALAELSGPLMSRLDGGADLLVINRFGKGEALGGGFRSAIAHAALIGIPVLTAVRSTYWEAWTTFAGREFTTLDPDADEIESWALTAMAGATLECRVA